MAGAVGKSVISTLLYNVRRCKQVEGLCVVGSKVGHRFKSEYKVAVLQELNKPLIIDEQKRKKLQKDEVSMLC
jgi:predicted ATP-dependent protease